MNAVLDDSLVGLMLIACSIYAFAKLGPSAAWRRVLSLLAAMFARAPTALRLRSAGLKLARAAAEKAQGGCGGCGNCGSEAQPQASGAEIGVPIANIPRARPQRKE